MATSAAAAGDRRLVVITLMLLVTASIFESAESLKSNYYATSCSAAESTIASVVSSAIHKDKRVGAGMLRLFFHDCFVEGCDASVLIDSPTNTAEKDAVPNQTLHSLEVIDNAKAAVEKICAKTVSCADIVAYAASISVKQLGGPAIDLKGGRLDGLVSSQTEANNNIPSPLNTLAQLKSSFASKGLSTKDLVLLSGAHTIGKAHCGPISGRIRNFSSTADVDPSLDPSLAKSLRSKCAPNPSASVLLNMDPFTPKVFDNKYYQGVQVKKGLFTSDSQLLTSTDTANLVNEFAGNNADFYAKFSASLVKMGNIGIKTGSNGNIRTNCRSFT